MFNLSDDDRHSTKLEGKKLKNRGAKFEGENIKGSEQLDITENSPLMGEDNDLTEDQEFFKEQLIEPETEQEREERLKKEREAARRQQEELLKLQGQQEGKEVADPNLALDKIEQGIFLSQNKGEVVVESEARGRGGKDPEVELPVKKNDLAASSFLLGANAKNLDFTAEKEDQKSIPAKMLPDVRGKSQDVER